LTNTITADTTHKVRGCPLVVHYWADLQSMHGFRCYDKQTPLKTSISLRYTTLLGKNLSKELYCKVVRWGGHRGLVLRS